MVIDLDEKADRIGIDLSDYEKAHFGLNQMILAYRGNETEEQYISAIKSLPEKQMVALIRWNRLDVRLKDYFDWNGIKR